jgi:hypothetical protein
MGIEILLKNKADLKWTTALFGSVLMRVINQAEVIA